MHSTALRSSNNFMSNTAEPYNSALEIQFVREAIQKHLQERWLDALTSRKRRWKILHRLAEGQDLRAEFVYSIHGGSTVDDIVQDLRTLGTQTQAYIISEHKPSDASFHSLEGAVDQVWKIGLGSIVCCGDQPLYFFQGELNSNQKIFWPSSLKRLPSTLKTKR